MLGSKTLGRVLVFGIGYVLGSRAGRERYAQIQAGARMLANRLRERYETDEPTSTDGPRERSGREGYDDITFGR